MKAILAAVVLALLALDAEAATRNRAQRDAFVRTHACPATHSTKPRAACPGYVVDHIKPLCKGGPDKATNMQWQTVAAAKAKDKWECKK